MLSEEAMLRFWSKVQKSDGCWLWTGAVQGGYGGFTDRQCKLYAHRVSWEESNGSIPSGLKVLHTCDVPLCVNPEHLFLGTSKDNTQDMVQKGRSAKGEKQGSAVLTKEIVLLVRKLYIPRHPTRGCSALARRFRVSPMTISRAIRRECWGHV